MKLLELQVKYGINVVSPEDEISDFDLEKGVMIQNRLDEAQKYLMEFQGHIPECVRNFEEHYTIIPNDKLDDIEGKLCRLKHEVYEFRKKIAVHMRNEKYKYQGYHAL